MPPNKGVKKVLLLGSGAIKIGEAGEFDYSGAQAIKALKEEGIKTVLVNPNIATIQTDDKFVDKVYFLPVAADYVERVIREERPDAVLLGFGGQTALNCGVELAEKGVLERYGVEVLGTGVEVIELADNREAFRGLMIERGVPVPRSGKAGSVEEALRVAEGIGYPVMVRVAYTLGGQGSGVARDARELTDIVSRGLVYSRIGQVLVEEYLGHWKEVEYEVLRDRLDNCSIVCNMENLDPMGIHTGDSIVVAPSQTLNNDEYQSLRTACFKVVRALGIVGECNVQFALDPGSDEYRVIEVNSRLSRSSALASKATGYPIAYVAAKLSLGYTLPELVNKVTGVTTAFFEPSLDYVVVKMPRWDFPKFRRVDREIGTQMKSVGEAMAIGRSFKEALQKAVRMAQPGSELTEAENGFKDPANLREALETPTDRRLFEVAQAYRLGLGTDEIHGVTGIDPWFLEHIHDLVRLRDGMGGELTNDELRDAKKNGFSDAVIAKAYDIDEPTVRVLRRRWGIAPAVKQIDTMAAEWPSSTNYLYMTYNGDEDDITFNDKDKAVVLGSGSYRIGSSVEFDWCCVNMAWSLKDNGVDEVIMVNYNPETVSTDYDVLDKLYLEELTLERVLDIVEKENPRGVVVSVGGQIPNNLALGLHRNGVEILGTPAEDIDRAENRARFSALLDELEVKQPLWAMLESMEQAQTFASQIGYPVLIRPSYVLSGSAMSVAHGREQLTAYLRHAAEVSPDSPVTISRFVRGAKEVEVDGVCDGENVHLGPVIEHIENAGVHSGDATMVIPTLTLSQPLKDKVKKTTRKIARALGIRGPFNIQFLAKDGEAYVIECNLRASRSMPFVSKTTGVNLMELAAVSALGGSIAEGDAEPLRHGVKSPMFSFMRLAKAEPLTGVEMASTGEVACFGRNFREAFLDSLVASGVRLPETGDTILVTVGGSKDQAVEIARKAYAKGFRVAATRNTAKAIKTGGVPCRAVHKVSEGGTPNILDMLENDEIQLVINTPNPDRLDSRTVSDGYMIRRKSVEYGIPLITNLELAGMLVDML